MSITSLFFPDVKLIEPKVYSDTRGFFKEIQNQKFFSDMGIDCTFVQMNHSFSSYGVLRGMHFQVACPQAKHVIVLSGEIYDVVVDIRPHSATFRQWIGVRLKADLHQQLFIPAGFAHGFCVLSPTVHLIYQCSALFNSADDRVFCYNDPEIGIVWPIDEPLLSDKDRLAPRFKDVRW